MEITIKLNGSNEEILDLSNSYTKEIIDSLVRLRQKNQKLKDDVYSYHNYFDIATSPEPEEKK